MSDKQSEVLEALSYCESQYLGHSNHNNPNKPVAVRLVNVMAAMYANNEYPPQSLAIVQAYRDLQTKGTYC